jgi:hypothetical protein
VLLQPLPYPQPDRLVQLRGSTPGGDYNPTSIPRFMAYRALSGVLQDVTAYDWNGGSGVNLGSGDGAEQVRGEHVSEAYFRLFGARFALGRAFLESEDRPGGPPVVVLSSGLWQRRFAADRNVVGRPILLGGDSYTVVGVTNAEFAPDPAADLWTPLQPDPNTTNHSFYVYCAGRLRPGVTLGQAQAALHIAADDFRRRYPGLYGLIAFTREQRTLEFGIRLALGTDGPRLRNLIMRQAMTLAAAGIAVGLGAAVWLTRLMSSLLFGVQPHDPLVFATVPVQLAAIAWSAAWLPARRAVKLEPLAALRRE